MCSARRGSNPLAVALQALGLKTRFALRITTFLGRALRLTFPETCHRHCVRAVKEMDSKSIGLCPQGFESPRCRFHNFAIVFVASPALRGRAFRRAVAEARGAARLRAWTRKYTWPGSNWRPSACEADVIATRPQVLAAMERYHGYSHLRAKMKKFA